MTKHTILFLAANPLGTDRLALDEEARAIQVELERSGHRDKFELVTRWAVQPMDLLRDLRKLKPTIVHFSGHGGGADVGDAATGSGLVLQGPEGQPQLISTAALQKTLAATGSSVKLVVLSACYSEPQAEALLAQVDCVVGMAGSIRDDAAKSFAIGFYGGLGEGESAAAAFKQGCAAISLEDLTETAHPQFKLREGAHAGPLLRPTAVRPTRRLFRTALRRTEAARPRADDIRYWLGVYVLVMAVLTGGYLLVAPQSMLPLEDSDRSSCLEIVIPFLFGQIAVVFKSSAALRHRGRLDQHIPLWLIRALVISMAVLLVVEFGLLAVGGLSQATWTPSPGSLRGVLALAVAALNGSTIYILLSAFEYCPNEVLR